VLLKEVKDACRPGDTHMLHRYSAMAAADCQSGVPGRGRRQEGDGGRNLGVLILEVIIEGEGHHGSDGGSHPGSVVIAGNVFGIGIWLVVLDRVFLLSFLGDVRGAETYRLASGSASVTTESCRR